MPAIKTQLRSMAARHLGSEARLLRNQRKARRARERQGEPPTVHYFHQVDDPYSHLAVQKLDLLSSAYTLPFQAHLAASPDADYLGSAEHFSTWARRDAASVAAAYGTEFSPTVEVPSASAVAHVADMLAPALADPHFAPLAVELGNALWQGRDLPQPPGNAGQAAVAQGTALRHKLGHYAGGMFYFDGEWFWGIDRIRRLEARLISEGFSAAGGVVQVPEPVVNGSALGECEHVTLEYFPSLRSPYTAIGHADVVALAERTGVQLKVRPVMPMLMRGVPAPWFKQRYIMMDSAREGRALGRPFGRLVDPFGAPVKRAFALFPGAQKLGKAMEFITAYLNAAWFDGIDITRDAGLAAVAQAAGTELETLRAAAAGTDWEALLECNLQDMLGANLWGVPSFRVTSEGSTDAYVCWGQDRIWRVAAEIEARRS